jgi:hypothetical protein
MLDTWKPHEAKRAQELWENPLSLHAGLFPTVFKRGKRGRYTVAGRTENIQRIEYKGFSAIKKRVEKSTTTPITLNDRANGSAELICWSTVCRPLMVQFIERMTWLSPSANDETSMDKDKFHISRFGMNRLQSVKTYTLRRGLYSGTIRLCKFLVLSSWSVCSRPPKLSQDWMEGRPGTPTGRTVSWNCCGGVSQPGTTPLLVLLNNHCSTPAFRFWHRKQSVSVQRLLLRGGALSTQSAMFLEDMGTT